MGTTSRQRAGARRGPLARAAGRSLVALEQLPGALGTALLALGVLLFLLGALVTSLVGIGLLALPAGLRGVHAVAERERGRLGRWGPEVVGPGPPPRPLRDAVADPATRRQLRWLAGHATGGLLSSAIGLLLPIYAVRELTFPLWWQLLPEDEATDALTFWVVEDWADVVPVTAIGLVWALLTVVLTPPVAGLLARRGRRLLAADAGTDLSLRVAELTATRAAALDAHATELRRIERSLHDGAQNRLVGVTVLLGAARRAVPRDPAAAEEILGRAQDAAEQALAELRSVARGILPPVLEDRGLAGALTGLAATSAVPCQVDVDVPVRCAASVEATAYFAVAEALTNVSRHSGAGRAAVQVRLREQRLCVRVTDDGAGGAVEGGGSGLVGIRRRVEAHDGTLTLTSPPGGPTTLTVELPCGS
ncbi:MULTISPECIES: sensor histidine kinase [unclassified Modestobacter]|uniref:sensor histidine kinase n=1 Tax=unclassified Modestobacter TaxID=2643866 RepID=UPI0022AA3652|nr:MULTISPECIES: sensor histidine kinase [unclassified Modestobacter]MCZ2824242.1 sensor domain-containing protein [Modestobacter sp. VKM Ac-2981]MCZ2854230.1 sensor domain-containing protein [Modestobacter sp. VKM Ac-2982]